MPWLTATPAFALGGYVRAVVHEVPAVNVVYITVAIIVDTRFAVRLGLVGPELVAQILVIDKSAIIEYGDYDRLDRPVVIPGQ